MMMVGRDLKWDPKVRHFGDDAKANALLSQKRRDGFELNVEAKENCRSRLNTGCCP